MIPLRQQIGQMLIMGFNGVELDKDNPVTNWLSTDGLGGVILFDVDLMKNTPGKNLQSRQQIVNLNQQLKDYARKAPGTVGELPLLVGVDYEGGVVDRFKNIKGCMTSINPCQLTTLPEKQLTSWLQEMADMIRSMGFTLNFAPVVDLNLNDREGIIGKLGRSFSCQPEQVIRVARQFVSIFADNGISCCYKHFPGHGSATGDSHLGFVDVSDTFQFNELEPYQSLLASNESVAMVMTAHVINRQLDPSGMPATLSHPVLTGLLREKMGFDGVIISDDLQMNAISNHYSVEESLCLTINAGADMVIFANQLGSISATRVIDVIENLVRTNQICTSRIDQAYQRIVKLKYSQMAFA